MRKVLYCLVGLSLFTASSAFASAYRIPVQSYDSTAKAGANIASASGADAVYFNPAGAAWVKDGWVAQIDATYLRLTSVDYNGKGLYGENISASSNAENFVFPTLFLLSPTWKDLRLGFSITAPNGLAKRWEDNIYPGVESYKFSLQVYEFNPTLTYAFNDKFSIAGGVRMLYSSATVINQGGSYLGPAMGEDIGGSREMSGSSTAWGYNLAADFRPTKEMNLALTFRSRVDLDFTGDVTLNGQMYGPLGGIFGNPAYAGLGSPTLAYMSQLSPTINTRGAVSIPSPAVLSLSGSYNFGKTTAELTVSRTYWSKLKSLDFTYSDSGNPVTDALFNSPEPKDWHDTTSIALGLEYAATQRLTLMAGICYDESPAPDYTLGFELPDSDAWTFSVGGRYALTDHLDVGLGVLYDTLQSRWVNNSVRTPANPTGNPTGSPVGINGEISGEAALLVTLGLQYRF